MSLHTFFLHRDIQLTQNHLLKRLLNFLNIFVKNQLAMNIKAYFITLSSVPSICMFILPCLDFEAFTVMYVNLPSCFVIQSSQ